MKVFRYLMLALAVLVLAGCSNGKEAEKVAQKIQSGETLTQGDYTCMIEYYGDYATKAQTYQDVIDDNDPTSELAQSAAQKLSELTTEYQYVPIFKSKLDAATPEEVGPENVKLVDSYASLIWFSAPSWATINAVPGQAGVVMETPADSGAVIATDQESLKLEER